MSCSPGPEWMPFWMRIIGAPCSVLRLTHEGLLLSLCSKNNETDVWKLFDEHPGMVLRRSDIIAWRINWRNKADNVTDLAHDLDLGRDAVMFLDQNPLEREQMRTYLPRC
jgi:FkbH-like protein